MKYCKVYRCRYAGTHVTSGHRCGTCGQFGHGQVECNNDERRVELASYHTEKLPEELWCTYTDCNYSWSHTNSSHICNICNGNHSAQIHSSTASSSPSVKNEVSIKCPLCRTINKFDNKTVVKGVDGNCCVCLTNGREVFFPTCGHICMCIECVKKLNTVTEVNNIITELSDHTINEALRKMGQLSGSIYVGVNAGMGCSWYVRRNSLSSNLEGFFMHSDSWGQYGENTSDVPQLEAFINGYQQIN